MARKPCHPPTTASRHDHNHVKIAFTPNPPDRVSTIGAQRLRTNGTQGWNNVRAPSRSHPFPNRQRRNWCGGLPQACDCRLRIRLLCALSIHSKSVSVAFLDSRVELCHISLGFKSSHLYRKTLSKHTCMNGQSRLTPSPARWDPGCPCHLRTLSAPSRGGSASCVHEARFRCWRLHATFSLENLSICECVLETQVLHAAGS